MRLEVNCEFCYLMLHYMLLKSDITCHDHMSVVMDPMNAGSRIVNFIVNFIRRQSLHNSEIYNSGAHAQ